MSTTPSKASIDLKSVAGLMAGTSALCEQRLGLPKDALFADQTMKVGLGLFSLVVMGEVKKGKSNFINALTGIRDLVPVYDEVATSTVFKILQGPEQRYVVFFQEEPGKPTRMQEITREQVVDYGTEKGNPGNIKKVDFIAVTAPSKVLRPGLAVVDTPGVGGLIKEHKAITFRHAPRADAVFFVVDSVESPIGPAEVAFLKDLRTVTSKIYFVQTKADMVTAEQAKQRMERNLDILEQNAGFKREELRYFIVSSTFKLDSHDRSDMPDLQDSGFIPLMAFLNLDLKGDLDRSIAFEGLRRTGAKLDGASSEIRFRRTVIEADTAAKRATLTTENEGMKQEVTKWNDDELPRLRTAFDQAVAREIEAARIALTNAISPSGSISIEISRRLERMDTVEEIHDEADDILERAKNDASDLAASISRSMEQRLKTQVEELEASVRSSVSGYLGSDAAERIDSGSDHELDTGGHRSVSSLKRRRGIGRAFETARTAVYGGTAAGGIATAVVAIGTLVCPGLGTLIAGASVSLLSTIGLTIWGAGAGLSLRNRNEGEAINARRELRGDIDRVLSPLLSQAHSHLSTLQTTLSVQLKSALDTIVKDARQVLESRRKLLDERHKQTQEQINAALKTQDQTEDLEARLCRELETLSAIVNRPTVPCH